QLADASGRLGKLHYRYASRTVAHGDKGPLLAGQFVDRVPSHQPDVSVEPGVLLRTDTSCGARRVRSLAIQREDARECQSRSSEWWALGTPRKSRVLWSTAPSS